MAYICSNGIELNMLIENSCRHGPLSDASMRGHQMCRVYLQLCDGATAAEKERWSLKAPQEFHYLNQSSCYNLPRVSNAEEYRVMLMICARHYLVLN